MERWDGEMTAAEWNAGFPEGSRVRYYPVKGRNDHQDTRTRSFAWTLHGGNHAVVMIEGKSGCVALSHLTPLPDQPADDVGQREG